MSSDPPFALEHPYGNGKGPWLRGNLHTHTLASDGALSAQAVVDAYAAAGYGFLMISDHDHFHNLEGIDPKGMLLVRGNEITAYGPHLLHVGAHRFIGPHEDRQRMIDEINGDGGFAIVNHPNWCADFNHCPQKHLETWRDYAGIEIYNGVTLFAEGSPLATDRWDQLLSQGRRVWGFANDDFHYDGHLGIAWNMVQVEASTTGALVRAMRQGRFYASTGVHIDAIDITGNRIVVDSGDTCRFRVHTRHGQLVTQADGPRLDYTVPAGFPHPYLRVECLGQGGDTAWLQPFFISH